MAAIERILIVHPEPATRAALELGVRRVMARPAAIYQAATPAQGLLLAGSVEPQVVLLDLTAERALALQVARQLRSPRRRVLGLFNPLLDREAEADFFRAAVRSGCSDFVALPASDAELAAAFDAATTADDGDPARAAGSPRTAAFVSHRGGVGKTTLAVNVAAALAETAARDGVALLDGVVRFGNAASFLALTPERDLGDVVRDLDRLSALSSYLTPHGASGLYVLASPRDPAEGERASPEQLSRVLLELRGRFEVVIVDAPAHLDAPALALLDLADLVFVLVEPLAPALHGARRFLDLLAGLGFSGERLRLVIGRYGEFEGSLDRDAVERRLDLPVDHVVPYERLAAAAAHHGTPLVQSRVKSEFARAVRRLADDIVAPRERAASAP